MERDHTWYRHMLDEKMGQPNFRDARDSQSRSLKKPYLARTWLWIRRGGVVFEVMGYREELEDGGIFNSGKGLVSSSMASSQVESEERVTRDV